MKYFSGVGIQLEGIIGIQIEGRLVLTAQCHCKKIPRKKKRERKKYETYALMPVTALKRK